ncbi:hypothetical protein QUF79_07555 [Fictibacillus enclensis]|uniref:hypothetical protein n=1 Tax=Fictibacillus enclensis TaxID=1017270 RepID=UPI0025A16642|nr:hypothetical protein [Fictibacillus enclensis]MDM5197869.1 hypothetical protein [Fictibacillus enclensis]
MTLTTKDLLQIKCVYGFTQMDIASLLGVSDAHISNVIKGKKRFTERLSNRLINELQLTDSKLTRIREIYREFKLWEAQHEST